MQLSSQRPTSPSMMNQPGRPLQLRVERRHSSVLPATMFTRFVSTPSGRGNEQLDGVPLMARSTGCVTHPPASPTCSELSLEVSVVPSAEVSPEPETVSLGMSGSEPSMFTSLSGLAGNTSPAVSPFISRVMSSPFLLSSSPHPASDDANDN